MNTAHKPKWVVDCKSVGNGHKALVYLGRDLYRRVIQERDISGCENGQVTYRFGDSETALCLSQKIRAVARDRCNDGLIHRTQRPGSSQNRSYTVKSKKQFPEELCLLVRARPTAGSDRGKRDLTLFVMSFIARSCPRPDSLNS